MLTSIDIKRIMSSQIRMMPFENNHDSNDSNENDDELLLDEQELFESYDIVLSVSETNGLF